MRSEPLTMSDVNVSNAPVRTLDCTPARHFRTPSGFRPAGRGQREGMKGLVRDDTSWSINLGTLPSACDGCLRYHTRHRELL